MLSSTPTSHLYISDSKTSFFLSEVISSVDTVPRMVVPQLEGLEVQKEMGIS